MKRRYVPFKSPGRQGTQRWGVRDTTTGVMVHGYERTKANAQDVANELEAAEPKKSNLEFQPIKMTFGFAIRAAMIASRWAEPGIPTASDLAAMTKRLPDLFPRPWTLSEARWAIEHQDELIAVVSPRDIKRKGRL